ncbi:uncharacterized protein LOC106170457 [Lingula anatina]|uniref:Uncharacterized protein LOC106170457 n=1 Tax=Lingula anatina TaxID=7574 RepID=A0A1S3J5V4_LINAN|nr:uncharacterized protein LOC106170457 [Lingula anatina]|eukprot:XP_013405775.1 uncharacterized protein LOC106170457 [Lingula anatina]
MIDKYSEFWRDEQYEDTDPSYETLREGDHSRYSSQIYPLAKDGKKYINRPLPAVPPIRDNDTTSQNSDKYYEKTDRRKRRIVPLVGIGLVVCLASVAGVLSLVILSNAATPIEKTTDVDVTTATTLDVTAASSTEVSTTELTTEPSTEPTTEITTEPTTELTTEPSTEPTTELTTEPTTELTTEPSTEAGTTEGSTTFQPTTEEESCGIDTILMNNTYFAAGQVLESRPTKVTSEAVCRRFCVTNPYCATGTFNKRTNLCYLSSQQIRNTVRQAGWSAFIKSDGCRCEMVNYTVQDFMFVVTPGNPMGIKKRFVYASSSADCANKCLVDSACAASQHNINENICELFDQLPQIISSWFDVMMFVKTLGCSNN